MNIDSAKKLKVLADMEITNGQSTMHLKNSGGLLAVYLPSWQILKQTRAIKVSWSYLWKAHQLLRKVQAPVILLIKEKKVATIGKSFLPKIHIFNLLNTL